MRVNERAPCMPDALEINLSWEAEEKVLDTIQQENGQSGSVTVPKADDSMTFAWFVADLKGTTVRQYDYVGGSSIVARQPQSLPVYSAKHT
jgi:hypothetical protein